MAPLNGLSTSRAPDGAEGEKRLGNMSSVFDGKTGQVTYYHYDGAGKVTVQRRPNGTTEANGTRSGRPATVQTSGQIGWPERWRGDGSWTQRGRA